MAGEPNLGSMDYDAKLYGWDMEYLEDLVEYFDSYDNSPTDNPLESSDISMSQFILAIVTTTVYLFCFVFAVQWCRGLIRLIFSMKAVALTLAGLAQAGIKIHSYYQQELMNTIEFDGDLTFETLDDDYISEKMGTKGIWLGILYFLEDTFLLMDEILTAALMYELYLCACKMEFGVFRI